MSSDIKDIKNITILGAGMMGPGLAQIFAVKGYNATIWARRPEVLPEAIKTVRANLQLMAKNGIGREEDIEPAISKIKTTNDFEEAVKDADFVEEAIGEDLALKQDFFQRLDSLCSEKAILATNTSVISITEIAEKSKLRDRIVGTHFWNPPHLIPLVEVIKAKDTSEETMDKTMALMAAVGKKPVKVKKDVPGFLANRLQHALWREAISIVERGIADPEEVDEAVKSSFGLRLPVLGPIENADLAGLDLTYAIHDYVLKYIEDAHGPSPILKEKVDKGDLGLKTGKGFKDWPTERANGLRQGLVNHLLKWEREHGE
ncbi:MAG: 3-hydroxyacyl-CoA dehydrogenase family protein [Deltaproteobacteria bacterium]|nr:3-hydroxyacyl-CoA dehydrogenase family protein [Deltaproteobacteria bacterium]